MINLVNKICKQCSLYLGKLLKMKYFNEIYALCLSLITVLGWKFNNFFGMTILVIISIVILFLTQDLKYIIPEAIYFIFLFSKGFPNNSLPVSISVLGTIFLIVLLIFSFRSGFHFKKMKSFIGLLGLAVTTFIPIFWSNISKENSVFYFLFLGNLGYLFLYIILSNGMKENSLELLAVSMSYLVVILSVECVFKVVEISQTNPKTSILELWYYLGWGLCNEAGIMICVSIPFVFYLLAKSENLKEIILQNLKVVFAIIGIILTTSRGTYLFGTIEIVVFYFLLLFISKKRNLYQNIFIVCFSILLFILFCLKNQIIDFTNKIMIEVFKNKLDSNGRTDLWRTGIGYWMNNFRNFLFGAGMACVQKNAPTALGEQLSPVVFHSTLVETLSSSGIFGVTFLGIHFWQKYKNLKKTNFLFFLIIGIGYLVVDIYGMIDNTYHMYYYMIPLTIILAAIDTNQVDDMKNQEDFEFFQNPSSYQINSFYSKNSKNV